MKIGRNQPCPCGSGKKFKHCCLGKDQANDSVSSMQDFAQQLRQAVSGQEFESLDHARAFMQSYLDTHNRQSHPTFHGLSPDQMSRLLSAPFDSPQIVAFPERIEPAPAVPIVDLFMRLAEAIGEKGLKATATGNLPIGLCREMIQEFSNENEQIDYQFPTLRSEVDFQHLHVTRITAQLAKLVRKYKGRFVLTKRARELLDNGGPAIIYPSLLRAYAEKYNWAYTDRYPQIDIIQRAFAFTLYLLNRYGDTETSPDFYAMAFIEAFPMDLDQIEGTDYSTPIETFVRCFALRTLIRFLRFFGLIELEPTSDDPITRKYRIQKLPPFNAAVKFHV